MGFQHVALGRTKSVSYIACLHGDQQSLCVCCGGEGTVRLKWHAFKNNTLQTKRTNVCMKKIRNMCATVI